jgi:hypothetical protein
LVENIYMFDHKLSIDCQEDNMIHSITSFR